MTAADDALDGFLREFVPSTTLNPGECARITRSFLGYLESAGWRAPLAVDDAPVDDREVIRRYYRRVRESHPSPTLLAAVDEAEANDERLWARYPAVVLPDSTLDLDIPPAPWLDR